MPITTPLTSLDDKRLTTTHFPTNNYRLPVLNVCEYLFQLSMQVAFFSHLLTGLIGVTKHGGIHIHLVAPELETHISGYRKQTHTRFTIDLRNNLA